MFRTFHFGELKSLELLYEQLKKCYELYQVHDSSLADYLKLLLKESQRHFNQRGTGLERVLDRLGGNFCRRNISF